MSKFGRLISSDVFRKPKFGRLISSEVLKDLGIYYGCKSENRVEKR